MPKHSTREEWLTRTDGNGHLVKEWCALKDKDHFFCKICPASFVVSGKGYQAVTQHAKSAKHVQNSKAILSPLQLTLAGVPAPPVQDAAATVPPPQAAAIVGAGANQLQDRENAAAPQPPEEPNALLKLVARRDAAINAELLWAMKCVQSYYSNNSCDDIVPLFRSMFGNDHVPKDMSLGRTKVTYLITDALGPYFHNHMLKSAHVALSFTICFDETVNNKRVKELQIGIRFWCEENKEVSYNHLETIFIGSATGPILSGHLLAAMERASLSLHRFLMISCDGPNVNKTVIRLINEKVKEVRHKGLLDAGTCNLHILHNSFLAGLDVFGEDVGQLVISIYEFFDGFPSRDEEYKKSQVHTKVPNHSFIKHVTSRWLTLSGSAERLLEQWPAVVHFFLTVIARSNTDSHKKIRETQRYLFIKASLKDPTFQAKISFVIQSAKLFERYSKIFQKSEPMIHLLYDELSSLYVLLLGRFCKSELVSTSRSCLKEDFFTNKGNLLPLKDIDVGVSTAAFLSKCDNDVDVMKFKLEAQKHYQAAARHLLLKSVLSKWPDGKHLRCLQPGAIKDPSSPRSIVLVHKMLRLDLGVDQDKLKDEWRLLQSEEIPAYEPSMRIDHFWRQVFVILGPDGLPKFPNIAKVVKAALPIAHGSSDVERGFSESGLQMQPNQARMEERLLNSKLWVKDGLKPYGGRPDLVPITRELLTAGHRAYRNYSDYLQEKRDMENEKIRQAAEEEERRRLREISEEEQRKERASLETLQEKLTKAQGEERNQRKAADQLVGDARKKLDAAIKKKDLAAVQVAQGMLESAKTMLEKAENLEKRNQPLQKKVAKRTSGLLEKMFQNHSKSKRPRNVDNDDPDDPDPVV